MTEVVDELKQTLAASLGEVQWSDLQAHAARDALFIVVAPLSVIDVALAIARDDSSPVEAWLQAGLLSRPSLMQIETWSQGENVRFRSAIVQPFVVAELLLDQH